MNKSAILSGVAAALFAAAPALSVAVSMGSPPSAPMQPVTDDYFGTKVVDNYRYLEDLGDPKVQSWMKAQADFTRSTLESIPGRQALAQRIHELANANLSRAGFERRGNRYFYLLTEPGAQLPKLYYRDTLQGEEHLLLDPAKLGEGTKTHFALDFYTPSWDGHFVAYGLSAGGSEDSVLHVLETQTGKALPEAIDRTSNSVVAWRPDNKSFFYLRYAKPVPGMPVTETRYNGRTYLHKLAAQADGNADPVVFGRGVNAGVDVPEGQGTFAELSPDSSYVLAVANHNMDDNPSTLFVAPLSKATGPNTPWKKIADVADGVTEFKLRGNTLYFLAQKGAPHFHLLSTPLAHPDVAHAKVIVPAGDAVITGFADARDALYLSERSGSISHLVRVSWDGKESKPVDLPFEGSVFGLTADSSQPGLLFGVGGWVHATQRLVYDPQTGSVSDTGLVPPSKVDYSQFESREVYAVSYDGTRVPLSIVYKKGLALDASHPVLLQGYGAYGITLDPAADPIRVAWLERGGVSAIAHIRGGGENGEGWHLAGQKLTKLNTVFDFIACGQYLVDERYTTPSHLAGVGGSAGGITVGGALTWRPDLFGVILDNVGVSDTLREELTPNGPPNIVEFGSVTTEDGFHGLYAMGAYYHVSDGVAYPAVMFTTGANDPRVAPWQMTKMAARMQASGSKRPALLRIDYDAGHGMGSTRSQREALTADLWSFALWQMGEPGFQPLAN
jgi:prolyl oligopeptidase